ncbi:hypothetical protein [Nocardia asteroides]|uniref:hypothetical protein n=1 Tax=Nocardia asteroides TaxID=1824 RepID=UPI001E522DCE|nr:hypothetical protein [Nocardia asteroides]UGT64506.1 hypothetical protein LTT61_14995 [Nocardia asteroides]
MLVSVTIHTERGSVRFDYRACVTAATAFAAEVAERSDVEASTSPDDSDARLRRLPNERLYLP